MGNQFERPDDIKLILQQLISDVTMTPMYNQHLIPKDYEKPKKKRYIKKAERGESTTRPQSTDERFNGGNY